MAKTSVIITSHNYGKYLSWCISSVLHQTREPFEVIVVDDDSADETGAVAEKYRDSVRYFRVGFRDAQEARNLGLSKASGEYVMFLDADDFLDNAALESLERELDADSQLKLVYSDRFQFGNPDAIAVLGHGYHRPAPEFDIEKLRYCNFISLPALVRKCVFPGFDPRIRRNQDWDAWLGCLRSNADAKRVAQPLFSYRLHGGNKTFTENLYIERLKILLKHGLIESVGPGDGSPRTAPERRSVIVLAHSPENLSIKLLKEFLDTNSAGIRDFFLVVGKGQGDLSVQAVQEMGAVGVLPSPLAEDTVDAALNVLSRKRYSDLASADVLVITDFSAPIPSTGFDRSNAEARAYIPQGDPDAFLSARRFEDTKAVVLNQAATRELLYLRDYQGPRSFLGRARQTLLRELNRHLLWRFRRSRAASQMH